MLGAVFRLTERLLMGNPLLVSVDSDTNLLPNAVRKANATVVAVANFGARGDGITDDTTAVQSAVDAIRSAGGGIVLFGSGKSYWISGAVTLPSNVIIEGNGAAVLKRAASTNRVVFANQSDANATGYGAGGRNITIRNLRFVGDYTIPAASYKDIGVGFNHVAELTIDNCSFEQGMNNSHYVDLLGCTNVRIRNSNFRGMRPVTGREYIEAIQIDVSTRQSTSYDQETLTAYDGLPTRGVLVEGCRFATITVDSTTYSAPNPIGSHVAALDSPAGYYRDIRFVNNTVEGFNSPATNDAFGWLHLRGAASVNISGNTFIYTGAGGSGAPTVISLIPVTSGIAASDVQATNPTAVTFATVRPCVDATITDNRFIGFNASTIKADSALINIDQASRVIVARNTADGSSAGFVRVNASRCTIVDNSVQSGNGEPVVNVINSQFAHVKQNDITAATGGVGVKVIGGSNNTVAGNTVSAGATAYIIDNLNNGIVEGNQAVNYTATGYSIAPTGVMYDVTLTANRARTTTSGASALVVAANSNRLFRYGNRWRDGGTVTDSGTGTITAATDQTS